MDETGIKVSESDVQESVQRGADAVRPYLAGLDFDLSAPVVDLLTDLMHYCKRSGVDFDDAVRWAADQYRVEFRVG